MLFRRRTKSPTSKCLLIVPLLYLTLILYFKASLAKWASVQTSSIRFLSTVVSSKPRSSRGLGSPISTGMMASIPYALSVVKSLFQSLHQDFVCGFYLAVCLRVFNRAKALVDIEFHSRFLKFAVCELGSIIRDEDGWYPESGDDLLPYEFPASYCRYGGQGFGCRT
ncbi:hypothetical protein PIB30_106724 [Stylosanthes scabra]|uniref:Uncharacterized protein n=1 Tax=Stylosanthes scabra TaxID=79078 RepID=A0ABU6T199_9FABA|nr:hypothetical protein [Stylosanthes scabra]